MGWYSKQKSGPVYSNVSLIKRSLFQSKNGKLPYHDIILYLRKIWNKNSIEDIDYLVDIALHARKSYFKEDENGLWKVKQKIENLLDPIEIYAKQILSPFTIKETYKLLGNLISQQDYSHFLKSDIRFVDIEGTDFWVLSEWELINDLAFNYMQENQIESQKKQFIYDVILKEYDINKNQGIFAPDIDERFNVRKDIISINTDFIESSIEVDVPKEVTEEVARASLKIMNWIDEQQSEFKTKNCIPIILGIKIYDKSFKIYYQALEDFFSLIPTIMNIKKGTWVKEKEVPDFKVETSQLNYAVYGSKPDIKNYRELLNQKSLGDKNISDHHGNSNNVTSFANLEKENYYFYNTVSYYERVKGYLNLPTQFISNVEKVKDQYFGKLQLEIEKFIYECWWRIKDDKLYCYGDGIFDFYADYIIKPGHRLKIEFKSDDTININLIGIDERYAKEQTRYLDIGKLAEESNSVNKSIFTIMCEVLATYPSGMHWTTLYDKVNELRMTTQNTVTNLLSKNPCFENLQDKKGYWRLNVSKLSRYYINEENKEVVQTTDLSYKPESNVQRKIINKRDYSDRENRSYYKDPHPIDQEYELPPLKDSFRNWAKKQPSIRYNKLVNQAQNQSQLIEIVTKAYSKLLCKFASSRETYSLEYMDLVQEGFLGLYKAIKKYNGKNSFAHYARTWINQRLGRYKIDKSNLIRIPVHMVEEINKLNKFIDEYLINENKFPNKNEVSEAEINTNAYDYISLYTIDYVSFEQYWGYLAGESNLTYTNPWYAGELISSNLYRTYYLSKGKKYKEEIEDLLKIEEQNSEILWTEMSVDTEINEKVLRHILYEFLNKLTEKEKKVLEFRFGLLDNKERTLEEVGEILGVTRERIRQIEKKALNKLRNLKKIKELRVFIT